MSDALQRQFSLLPEGRDQRGPALHRLRAPTREVADLLPICGAEVGDLVLLQVGPDRLDGIELGGVRRQRSQGEVPALAFEPRTQRAAAMGGRAVPDDEQPLLDLLLERTEELDDLRGLDGAVEEAEVKAPPTQPGDGRHLVPAEA